MTCSSAYGINAALEIIAYALTIPEPLGQKNTRLVLIAVAVFAANRRITAFVEVVRVAFEVVETVAFGSSTHRLTDSVGSALYASTDICAFLVTFGLSEA